MKTNKIIFAALAVLIVTQGVIHACAVKLTNNTANPVLVVEKEGKYAQVINPSQAGDIGSSAFHANFFLFEQINNKFIPRYSVDQASCNMEKHQNITVGEIINNSGDVAEFFTVTALNVPATDKPCCNSH